MDTAHRLPAPGGVIRPPSHAPHALGRAALSLLAVVLLLGLATGCATTGGSRIARKSVQGTQIGMASYYAHKFHGRRTASGQIYDMHGMTAAHRKLPFGTRVRVTNLHNHKSVELIINDRGPFKKGRIIDVSYGAARKLGMIRDGTAKVRVRVLS